MEGRRNFNDIVAEPLTEDSSYEWFEWVENYLISQDLWEVTNNSARPNEIQVEDFAKWRRNNAAALQVIRISCGRPNQSHIRGVSEAKVAWDILYCNYHDTAPRPFSPVLMEAEELEMSNLHKAIAENDWSYAKASIDRYPQVLDVDFAKSMGETPLHVAAKFGHLGIVEELVRIVPEEYLEIRDAYNNTPLAIAISENNWSTAKAFIDRHPKVLDVDFATSMAETPLHVAAKFGHLGIVEELVRLVPEEYLEIRDAYYENTPLATVVSHSGLIPVAACLINKNKMALAIPTKNDWEIPATSAFYSGHKEMGRYLYSVTPLQVFKPRNGTVGPEFLHACLRRREFDIALDLLQRQSELLFAADSGGEPTIQKIAHYLHNFLDKSQLPFWKRWFYHRRKELYEMKPQHAQAAAILNLVCENLKSLNEVKKNMFKKALTSVAKRDDVEFLLQVMKVVPELITLVSLGEPDMDIFLDVVKYRRTELFNLLHGSRFKNKVESLIDTRNSNTLLHVAATLAPSTRLNRIPGAALQMQRELQWFKAVESMVDPGDRLVVNKEGLTPIEFFKEDHKELRAQGEKWMKDTTSSCSVVGALIVTIMFTAALTVPGGNNQDSGYPIFMKKKLFEVFLISDALSLFSSTTSVLTFLGILTSRYAEEDFLYSLPTKLIIGLSALFLSIATMMISFSATIMIMVQYNSLRFWVTVPIVVLAGVPVTLFVLLQFPLLVEVFSSTYGPHLFKKKVLKWP
ncbi:uncharacterized protein LOC114727552 [Neltuma alba]|uniref:uncharacterized protein LOC114727552 n=1 Tax=Neltuma alba TaxID=207710 RepID=UPI0010A35525|nr:uncharacterized protein LOC114727552 [Prosopis alba]